MRLVSYWSTAAGVAFALGLLASIPVSLAADEPDLFGRLDVNQDGFITSDEVDADKKALLDRLLRTADKDKDGKLTREEFIAGSTSQQPVREAPQPRRPGEGRPQFDPAQLFNRIDQNGDGKILKSELPERLQAGFDKMDGNSDGQISRDEFMAGFAELTRLLQPAPQAGTAKQVMERASAAFDRQDANNDGKLTADEVPEDRREMFQRMLQRFGGDSLTKEQFVRMIATRAARTGGTPTPRPAINPEMVVTRILQADKDNDGQISREEAPERMREFFDRLDANSDGKLSQEELKTHAQRIVERLRSGDAGPIRKRLEEQRSKRQAEPGKGPESNDK